MHVPHYQKDMAEMNTRLIERTNGLLPRLAEEEKGKRILAAALRKIATVTQCRCWRYNQVLQKVQWEGCEDFRSKSPKKKCVGCDAFHALQRAGFELEP